MSRRQILATGANGDVAANFPSSPRRGGGDHNKISRSLLYGADGVVIKFHRILLNLNTTITGCALSRLHSLRSYPSARAKDASRRFLDRAATPPRRPRRGGENSPHRDLGNGPLRPSGP